MKKILFMTGSKNLTDQFVTAESAAKCKAYDFQLDAPAVNGDLTNPDWAGMIADYDALVTTWGSPVCNKEFLAHGPKVKVVGHCAGSVVRMVDDTTFETDVQITTANPVMAEAVAEWSLMVTLMAQRQLWNYAHLRAGEIPYWPAQNNMKDLKRMTIGLWGMGDITRHLLRFLAPLRPGRILVCSGHASAEELASFGAERATLEQLLKESDIFHCLVGVNKENFLRIGAKEFGMMKDGAVFVNGGRARLAKEEDLIAELQTGRISAYLDVYNSEPLDPRSPLSQLPNVFMTPHNAGFPGRYRYMLFLLDEFNRFFHGEKLQAGVSQSRYHTMTNETMR